MRTDLQVNNYSFRASFYDGFFKSLPNKDINNPAKLNKLGHALASPHWNRLALGVAAISTQPFIDYYNPKVDKDTAMASALRTTAKALVCTTVGFIVRGSSYKLVEKLANPTKAEGSTLLTPKEILKETNIEKKLHKLKLHKNTVSTTLALLVMMFTNVLIDAPYTTKLTNKFLELYKQYKSSQEDIN